MTLSVDIQRLRDRIEELEEECRQLRCELRGPRLSFDRTLRLRPAEANLLSLIAARAPSPVARESLYNGMWQDARRSPQEKALDVILHHVRRKIAPRGAVIVNHWGHGYSISRDDLAKLRERV